MHDVIDKTVATYMIYALWILVLSGLNFAGSVGLYQILSRLPSANESKAKAYAIRSASFLWLEFSIFIALPWCVPTITPEFFGLLGMVAGFLLCYALLGMVLGREFDQASKLASGKPSELRPSQTSDESHSLCRSSKQ